MSQHRLIDRARGQRRLAHALLERHALIRRTDMGVRMLRALDVQEAPFVPALPYLPPTDVQAAFAEDEFAATPVTAPAMNTSFDIETAFDAVSSQTMAPLQEDRAERTNMPVHTAQPLGRSTSSSDAPVRSSTEQRPTEARPPSGIVDEPPVVPAAPVQKAETPTNQTKLTSASETDRSAPAVETVPAMPTTQSISQATPTPAQRPAEAPRTRRLARTVQEGTTLGARPAMLAPADTLSATESVAVPQSDEAPPAEPVPSGERADTLPTREQTPITPSATARTPQEIAKLLFDDPTSAPAAHAAEQPANIVEPSQARRIPAAEQPVEAQPSADERLRAFQAEIASVRSGNAPSRELFQQQAQPRTPQEWARLLAEATNPQARRQEAGVKSQSATRSQEPGARSQEPGITKQNTAANPRSHPSAPSAVPRSNPAEPTRRFVRPMVNDTPAEATTAAQPKVDTRVDAAPTRETTSEPTEQSAQADVNAQMLSNEVASTGSAEELAAPRAAPAVSPAVSSNSAAELFQSTPAERTPQEWARLLAEATNPRARSQGPGARSQETTKDQSKTALPRPLPTVDSVPSAVPPSVVPLRETTRRFLRPIVGIDPDSVRVHRGPLADQVASAHAADAVTMGNDVLLAAGHDEESPETIGVLAHELTHVARARTPRFVPPIVRAAPQAANDEEPLARAVESRAIQAARREQQPTLFNNGSNAETIASQPRARTPDEETRWGDLPAPWEPLPNWLAGDNGQPTDGQRLTANDRRPANVGIHAPMSSFAPTAAPAMSALPAAAPAVATPAMHAEQGRSLDIEQDDEAVTAPATPAAPQPDLDALARQVYDVLKQRLAAEQRRLHT